MCFDHADRIIKACILDVLPSHYAWTNLNMKSALGSWHWLFLAQLEPFPRYADQRRFCRMVSERPRGGKLHLPQGPSLVSGYSVPDCLRLTH
jgi:hypothetical protein